MSKNQPTLPQQISAQMAAQGVTTWKLARTLNMSSTVLQRWLDGKETAKGKPQSLNTQTLERIAAVLGGPASWVQVHAGDKEYFQKQCKRD